MDGLLLSEIINRSVIAWYCVLVIYLVRLFLKKISRKYCYFLWLVVFLNLCIPFSIVSSFSLIPQKLMEFSVEEKAPEQPKPEMTEDSIAGEKVQNMIVFEGGTPYEEEMKEVFPEIEVPKKQDVESSSIEPLSKEFWLILGEGIWILGIFVLGCYSLWEAFRFNQSLKKEKSKVVDGEEHIIIALNLSAPVLWGFFSPTIYLPQDLEEGEKTYIIAHEKYHCKRKDYLVKPIIYMITIVYWFHPLVWLAYHLCCEDMEMSCDESVLEKAGSNIRKEYAHSLLKYAAKQNGFLLHPLTFGEPSLRSRIESILKYKKKNVYVTVIALAVAVAVGAGLILHPTEENSGTIEEDRIGNERIVNNGGEIIQVDENLYYMSGEPLYASSGEWFYTTNTNEEGIDEIWRYQLDGSGYSLLMSGTIVGMDIDGENLYYLTKGDNGENSFCTYHMESEKVCQIYEGEYQYLTTDESWVYYYEQTEDDLCIHRSRIEEEKSTGDEENLLSIPLDVSEISCFYVTDTYILFAAGVHEGSAGYFYGDFYSFNLETDELEYKHLTDDDKFYVFDGKIYYSKYSNEGFGESALYCADLDLKNEAFVGESMEFLKAIEEKNVFIASGEGKMFAISLDGKEKKCIFDISEHNWQLEELDQINFKEVNIIGDSVYAKLEQWGYRGEDGWRDTLVNEGWYRISLEENQSQVWTPEDIVEEKRDEEFGYLWNPTPGQPCDNPSEAGWDMEHIVDVRENFSRMSYVPEEGTEEDTYLLGKTESYTLYGKGDYRYLLLECEGKYAQVRYDYTSNYMTPLELMETDIDRDGKTELAIKFNVMHGTGVSVDTFLLADFGSDSKLYVHQYLDEDFNIDLGAALSFEKNEYGLQAKVNGENAGYFMENMEDMGAFNIVTVGSQMHFYYDQIENEIQLSGDIMFMAEDSVSYWINWNDVTATICWNGEEFSLSDFTSRNRDMEERIIEALEDDYGVENLYDVNLYYDSSDMNQETISVTAEILKTKSDRVYDRKEIYLKRGHDDAEFYGGWEIDEQIVKDHVLKNMNLAMQDESAWRAEVIGKKSDWNGNYGVREILIYKDDVLQQSVSIQEAIEKDGVDGIDENYTECPKVEETVILKDVNFDGYPDLEVWGWTPNNTIPYYYWCWNPDPGQYEYAFCLQLTEIDVEKKQLISWYKVENGVYHTEYYQVTADNKLELVEQYIEDYR